MDELEKYFNKVQENGFIEYTFSYDDEKIIEAFSNYYHLGLVSVSVS